MSNANWIAVDWGTSNLRIWAMSDDGTVLDEKISDQGMGKLKRDEFEGVLLTLAEDWLVTDKVMPVIACGMLGSRQGWAEAPYDNLPCNPATSLTKVVTKDDRISVYILAGIKNQLNGAADVMRGEETQIAGYVAKSAQYSGIICLPGTHAKWAKIEQGHLVDFNTSMTGELFQVISEGTILQHSLGDWNEQAFLQAVAQGYEIQGGLAASLFSIRAKSLLEDDQNGIARLSGLLIGNEIAGQQHMIDAAGAEPIMVLGENKLANLYVEALSHLKIAAKLCKANQYTLKGLYQAYKGL